MITFTLEIRIGCPRQAPWYLGWLARLCLRPKNLKGTSPVYLMRRPAKAVWLNVWASTWYVRCSSLWSLSWLSSCCHGSILNWISSKHTLSARILASQYSTLGTSVQTEKFFSKDIAHLTFSYSLFEIIQDKNILCPQNYTGEQNSDLCDSYGIVVGGALIVRRTLFKLLKVFFA